VALGIMAVLGLLYKILKYGSIALLASQVAKGVITNVAESARAVAEAKKASSEVRAIDAQAKNIEKRKARFDSRISVKGSNWSLLQRELGGLSKDIGKARVVLSKQQGNLPESYGKVLKASINSLDLADNALAALDKLASVGKTIQQSRKKKGG